MKGSPLEQGRRPVTTERAIDFMAGFVVGAVVVSVYWYWLMVRGRR